MKIELAKDDVRLVLTYKEWYQFRMVRYMFDNAEASEYNR